MSLSKVCPQCGAIYGAESRFCSVDGATLVMEQPADDLVGTIVADRYHILERIGAGGMGEVFLAEHVRMKRKSALKVMREALTSDPIAVSRFHREAENASQINHPNVAAVYDFGETPNGVVYIAMEYIPGEPLSDVLEEEGALNPARVADIIAQAADALSAAHGLGILHRDLKPDNIMLTSTRWGTDLVKLVDFGISRAMASATQQFTSTGMIVGTPEYMSPEQLTGDALDSRSDQYALALIAYFALTGAFPYPAGASKDALLTRLTTAPRKLADTKPDVDWPEALQATFDRALALDINERFAEVHEFGRELDAAIAQMPATDTMEHYREALRQRFTTPTRAPLVTPPRALPSLQMTPVNPVPSVATISEHAEVASEPLVQTPAEPVAPSLGSSRARRPSLGWRLTAVAATVALVAIVVWQYAAARPSTPATTAVDSSTPPLASAPATQPASAARVLPALQLDSVAALARSSVFPLFRDGQQGSAFLVDLTGIVLTSAEFARNGAEPRIQLDTGRHVMGRVMAVDAQRGVAALRIPIQHCRQCTALALATDSTSRVNIGDSLVLPAATTRGASAVAARGSVTQMDGGNIQTSLQLDNRAAIGAPVMSASNGVVALALRRRNGQANLVPAAILGKLRSDAIKRRSDVLPNDTLIPTWPVRGISPSELNAAKARTDAELAPYKAVQGDFELLVMTPHVMAWRAERIKDKIAAAQVMAIGDSQPRRSVDAIQSWREWNAYTGERRAVIVLHATPELAGYDRLRRATVVDLKHGDVGDLRLLRADTLVRPIEAARIPAIVNPEAYRSANQRVYSAGVAVYHPREFARRGGRFPSLIVELIDAQTRRSTRIILSEAALTAIERDLKSFQR
ncbi:MAG: protein kinase domain-containing protein [Gemmatimonadaceae bacterium]